MASRAAAAAARVTGCFTRVSTPAQSSVEAQRPSSRRGDVEENEAIEDRRIAAIERRIEAQRWLRNFGRDDKWNFCLTTGTLVPANQERE